MVSIKPVTEKITGVQCSARLGWARLAMFFRARKIVYKAILIFFY